MAQTRKEQTERGHGWSKVLRMRKTGWRGAGGPRFFQASSKRNDVGHPRQPAIVLPGHDGAVLASCGYSLFRVDADTGVAWPSPCGDGQAPLLRTGGAAPEEVNPGRPASVFRCSWAGVECQASNPRNANAKLRTSVPECRRPPAQLPPVDMYVVKGSGPAGMGCPLRARRGWWREGGIGDVGSW